MHLAPTGRTTTLFAAALFCTSLMATSFLPTSLPAQDAPAAEPAQTQIPWVVDVAKAKAQAKAEGKDLLINFTGSDWCVWCHRLEGEVFGQTAFLEYANANFVLLYLDFPNDPAAQAKVVDPELNTKLSGEYGVPGYPTIILADASGHPYGRTGYRKGGPEGYIEHMKELREKGAPIRTLNANGDPEKQGGLLEKAFPVIRAQDLFGFPEYKKYLTAAEKVPALADQVAGLRQNAELQKIMQNPEPPVWSDFYAFLRDSKHLSGMPFLQASFVVIDQHLIPEKKYDEALALLDRLLADPTTIEDTRLKPIFEEKVSEVKALRDGGDHDGHDHDGHDHDDHDHDDHEGHDHP